MNTCPVLTNPRFQPCSLQPKEAQNIFELLTQWEIAPYDDLKGKLPDWTPEVIIDSFSADQYKIDGEILDGRASLSEAVLR